MLFDFVQLDTSQPPNWASASGLNWASILADLMLPPHDSTALPLNGGDTVWSNLRPTLSQDKVNYLNAQRWQGDLFLRDLVLSSMQKQMSDYMSNRTGICFNQPVQSIRPGKYIVMGSIQLDPNQTPCGYLVAAQAVCYAGAASNVQISVVERSSTGGYVTNETEYSTTYPSILNIDAVDQSLQTRPLLFLGLGSTDLGTAVPARRSDGTGAIMEVRLCNTGLPASTIYSVVLTTGFTAGDVLTITLSNGITRQGTMVAVSANAVFSATTTASSTSVTGIAAGVTATLVPGSAITGTGIPSSTTIVSVDSTSLILSHAATASATVTLTSTGGTITVSDVDPSSGAGDTVSNSSVSAVSVTSISVPSAPTVYASGMLVWQASVTAETLQNG